MAAGEQPNNKPQITALVSATRRKAHGRYPYSGQYPNLTESESRGWL